MLLFILLFAPMDFCSVVFPGVFGADIGLLDLNEEMLTNLVDFFEGGSAPVEISKVSEGCLGMD